MTNPVLRVRQRLAYALRQLSYFVGPRPVPMPPGTPTTIAEFEAASAVERDRTDHLIAELLVRQYLDQAINRFSPTRLPGQA